jgi:antitoxin ParD1/3/4
MDLSLTPDVQHLIDQRVRSGKYATPEDVVAAALISLAQQEESSNFAPGELDELLAKGERSIEQEGTLDGDKAFQRRRERRQQRQSNRQ